MTDDAGVNQVFSKWLADDEARAGFREVLESGLGDLVFHLGGRDDNLKLEFTDNALPWPAGVKISIPNKPELYEGDVRAHAAELHEVFRKGFEEYKPRADVFIGEVEEKTSALSITMRGKNYTDVFAAINGALQKEGLSTLDHAVLSQAYTGRE